MTKKSKTQTMQKFIKQIFLLVCLTLVLTLPYFAFADNPALDGLTGVGGPSGFDTGTDETSFSTILGLFVNTIFSLLGVIFIGLMIYGGYNWMTAAGDAGKLDTAKNTFKRAVVGLIIVVASFSIWNFLEGFIFG